MTTGELADKLLNSFFQADEITAAEFAANNNVAAVEVLRAAKLIKDYNDDYIFVRTNEDIGKFVFESNTDKHGRDIKLFIHTGGFTRIEKSKAQLEERIQKLEVLQEKNLIATTDQADNSGWRFWLSFIMAFAAIIISIIALRKTP